MHHTPLSSLALRNLTARCRPHYPPRLGVRQPQAPGCVHRRGRPRLQRRLRDDEPRLDRQWPTAGVGIRDARSAVRRHHFALFSQASVLFDLLPRTPFDTTTPSRSLRVINDFEAVGYGVLDLPESQLLTLNNAEPMCAGPATRNLQLSARSPGSDKDSRALHSAPHSSLLQTDPPPASRSNEFSPHSRQTPLIHWISIGLSSFAGPRAPSRC